MCNLSEGTTETCHVKTTPGLAIRTAVRASMSLPILLFPVQMPSVRGGVNDLFIDGGLMNNFPIQIFDNAQMSMCNQAPSACKLAQGRCSIAEDSFASKMDHLADVLDHNVRDDGDDLVNEPIPTPSSPP